MTEFDVLNSKITSLEAILTPKNSSEGSMDLSPVLAALLDLRNTLVEDAKRTAALEKEVEEVCLFFYSLTLA